MRCRLDLSKQISSLQKELPFQVPPSDTITAAKSALLEARKSLRATIRESVVNRTDHMNSLTAEHDKLDEVQQAKTCRQTQRAEEMQHIFKKLRMIKSSATQRKLTRILAPTDHDAPEKQCADTDWNMLDDLTEIEKSLLQQN